MARKYIKENIQTRTFWLVHTKRDANNQIFMQFSNNWSFSRAYYDDDPELKEDILSYSYKSESDAREWAKELEEGSDITMNEIDITEYEMRMVIQKVQNDYSDELPIKESRWDSNPDKKSFYITQYKGKKGQEGNQYDKDIDKFLVMGGKGQYFGAGITLSSGRNGVVRLSKNVFEKASISELINGVASGRDSNAMIRRYNKSWHDPQKFLYEKIEVGVFINKIDDNYNELQSPITEELDKKTYLDAAQKYKKKAQELEDWAHNVDKNLDTAFGESKREIQRIVNRSISGDDDAPHMHIDVEEAREHNIEFFSYSKVPRMILLNLISSIKKGIVSKEFDRGSQGDWQDLGQKIFDIIQNHPNEKDSLHLMMKGLIDAALEYDEDVYYRFLRYELPDKMKEVEELIVSTIMKEDIDIETEELPVPIDEKFNLHTLKKFREFGGEIYVTVKGRLNKNKRPRIFRVYDMSVKDIHDGTIRVRDGRAEFDIGHDDIGSTFTGKEMEQEKKQKAMESKIHKFNEFNI